MVVTVGTRGCEGACGEDGTSYGDRDSSRVTLVSRGVPSSPDPVGGASFSGEGDFVSRLLGGVVGTRVPYGLEELPRRSVEVVVTVGGCREGGSFHTHYWGRTRIWRTESQDRDLVRLTFSGQTGSPLFLSYPTPGLPP